MGGNCAAVCQSCRAKWRWDGLGRGAASEESGVEGNVCALLLMRGNYAPKSASRGGDQNDSNVRQLNNFVRDSHPFISTVWESGDEQDAQTHAQRRRGQCTGSSSSSSAVGSYAWPRDPCVCTVWILDRRAGHAEPSGARASALLQRAAAKTIQEGTMGSESPMRSRA